MSAQATWRRTTLGAWFRIRHGFAFKGEFFADTGKYVVLTPGNFRPEGGFKSTSRERYYSAGFPSDYLLKRGDLVIALTDLTQNAPILGSPAFIPADDRYLHNQRLGKIVDLNGEVLDERFLFFLLNTDWVRAQIKGSATGATVRHTAPDRIYAVEVDLPPLVCQQRIASILSAYDDLVENNTRRIAVLEEIARALYRQWFVHDTGGVRSRDGRFGDLATVERRSINPSLFPDEEFEHYSIPAFDSGRRPVLEKGKSILSSKFLIDAECVLISKLNPRIPRTWLPSPRSGRRAIASTEFLVLRPRAGFTRELLYATCASEDFAREFGVLAIGTSTSHQRVKPDSLLELRIKVPKPEANERFSSLITPMLELANCLRPKNANLRQTRDLLLPELVSGEIDVSDLDVGVGEPAA